MRMVGLIRNDRNTVRVANRILEAMPYNLFPPDGEQKDNVSAREGDLAGNRLVSEGRLNMRLIPQRSIDTCNGVFGLLGDRFTVWENPAKGMREFE